MRKATAKCVFQDDWVDPVNNPEWSKIFSKVDRDIFSARCNLCKKTFSLSNMGKRALTSHTEGKGHLKKVIAAKAPNPLFLLKNKVLEKNIETNLTENPPTQVGSDEDTDSNSQRNPEAASNTRSSSQINFFTDMNDRLTNAKIFWTLHIVETHNSTNSVTKSVPVMKRMFPDSKIAESLKIGQNKIGYSIVFGLAPYFENELVQEISSCDYYVVCFDEALNRVSQRGQMDLYIRYWNKEKMVVEVRYWKSVFMGSSKAQDILHHFREGLVPLNFKKMLQISMDGPNVNWKFLRLLTEEESTNLLELGSCGLHIIHGALQTGHKTAGWKICDFLKSIYSLFKDSPARRAAYTNLTEQSVFPLKFCPIRWVESKKCATRAIEILNDIKKYVNDKDTKLPSTVSVKCIETCLKDSFLKCKLGFFITISSSLEPFLRKFQSPGPLSPFLYNEISNVVMSIAGRFIKKDVLKNKTAVNISKLNFDDKNIYLPNSEIDVGFVAKKHLRESKKKPEEKLVFYADCHLFLKALLKKILERCCLKYKLTELISSLDPKVMYSDPAVSVTRMNNLLEILYEKMIITLNTAEAAFTQYKKLLEEQEVKDILLNYQATERLDLFFVNLVFNKFEYVELFKVIQIVLILSHGNATVESGFSVNKDMLIENMHEKSMIARRIVYDAIKSYGGVENINITPNMKTYFRQARMKYSYYLDAKKDDDNKKKQKDDAKRKAMEEVKILEKKKARLENNLTYETKRIDEKVQELKKKIVK